MALPRIRSVRHDSAAPPSLVICLVSLFSPASGSCQHNNNHQFISLIHFQIHDFFSVWQLHQLFYPQSCIKKTMNLSLTSSYCTHHHRGNHMLFTSHLDWFSGDLWLVATARMLPAWKKGSGCGSEATDHSSAGFSPAIKSPERGPVLSAHAPGLSRRVQTLHPQQHPIFLHVQKVLKWLFSARVNRTGKNVENYSPSCSGGRTEKSKK